MIGKLLTFIVIISIIKVCLADDQTQAPYICKSARCLYGSVELMSLKTKPNPMYSAEGEGENITLTVKDELTYVTQEYVNYWIKASDDSEPLADGGIWGTICVQFKDVVKRADSKYGISHRVIADLFRVYPSCPTEPMTFKPGHGFQDGFELERRRPPGPVFQYIVTIGDGSKYEDAYLTAIWKVTVMEKPDMSLSTESTPGTSSMKYNADSESGGDVSGNAGGSGGDVSGNAGGSGGDVSGNAGGSEGDVSGNAGAEAGSGSGCSCKCPENGNAEVNGSASGNSDNSGGASASANKGDSGGASASGKA